MNGHLMSVLLQIVLILLFSGQSSMLVEQPLRESFSWPAPPAFRGASPDEGPSLFSTRLYSTRSDTVEAGHLFVTNLPDSISGMPVYEYAARVLPLRSWLLKKSFFWKTNEADRGDHALTFYVFHEVRSEDTDASPADSIIVRIVVK
jgi:hypothetical protein